MTELHKLSHLVDGEWIEHSFAPVFSRHAPSAGGKPRIVAGVPAGDPGIFKRLTNLLEPPYFLLYVLHTPRGEGEAGRYQSPELSREQFNAFVMAHADFLCADARFDIWAHSPNDQATVVWDRHNQLFAYGPIERVEAEMLSIGFHLGEPDVPGPHMHHYRAEFDAMAKSVLDSQSWSHSPLRPEDEQ